MDSTKKVLFAKGDGELFLLPKMLIRHGLISGATGTGKTISAKVLAECFSEIGVPVFIADIKGDLAGLCLEGENIPHKAFPVVFWDLFGKQGHPLRSTFSNMGPLLISKLLNLNETQSNILNVVFKIADDMGMLIIDSKDLKEMLKYVGDNSKFYTREYGNISKQSIGAIQRSLLVLEEQGAKHFFGEPSISIIDFIRTDPSGRGNINILASEQLFHYPNIYATFLLWLLSELFEGLPEVCNLDKPRIVFFLDESQLLFDGTSKILVQKIEQIIRLIASKGVSVYFITRYPQAIPEAVLGQLENKVQHALRAFTPQDKTTIKAMAKTIPPNPNIDVEQTIIELGKGEVLVSSLDEEGSPSMVERAWVISPKSYSGYISSEQRKNIIAKSPLAGRYEDVFDRESAYEKLHNESTKSSKKQFDKKRTKDTPIDKMAKSAMSTMGREFGRELARGILGSLLKK